jgi:hypothetical protein
MKTAKSIIEKIDLLKEDAYSDVVSKISTARTASELIEYVRQYLLNIGLKGTDVEIKNLIKKFIDGADPKKDEKMLILLKSIGY